MSDSPFDRLIELGTYIEEQIWHETVRPTYNGTARALAYNRVLRRLKPIIAHAKRVRKEFNFTTETI